MGMPLQWHRRHAITLASQLPDDTADQLLVIEAMKELVEHYLMAAPAGNEMAPGNVLPFAGKA